MTNWTTTGVQVEEPLQTTGRGRCHTPSDSTRLWWRWSCVLLPVGRGTGRIFCSTLWTAETQWGQIKTFLHQNFSLPSWTWRKNWPGPGVLLLTEVFISDGRDEEGWVSGPFLNTREVEERETAGAAPHLGGRKKGRKEGRKEGKERTRVISPYEIYDHVKLCVCVCLTACVLLTEAMQIRQVRAPDWNSSLTYWPVLTRPVTSPPAERESLA